MASHTSWVTRSLVALLLGLAGAQASVAQTAPATARPTTASLEPKCKAGDAEACSLLGGRYEDGEGVPKNMATALELYRKGCDAKNPLGCYMLGYAHYHGTGIAKDRVKSAEIFRKGCDAGSPGSCKFLAAQYWEGDGVTLNKAISNQIMQLSCDMGAPDGCVAMGARHFTGSGAPLDKAKAAALFEKACNWNSARACGLLGSMHEADEPAGPDEIGAAKLFAKSCAGKDGIGCYYLGQYNLEGKGGLAKNPAAAAQLYLQSCNFGEGNGCIMVGRLYQSGRGVKLDTAQAALYERKGCELKSVLCKPATGQAAVANPGAKPSAAGSGTPDQMLASCRSYDDTALSAKTCLALGKLRTAGSGGVGKDHAAAFWLYSRSCDFGNAEGCLMTGAYFALGRTGVASVGSKPEAAGAAAYSGMACKADARLCGAAAIDKAIQYAKSADAR